MGLPRSNDDEARFSAYGEGLTGVIGHADGAQAASRLLLGFDDALRAQERGADGSDHSARTDRSPASVAAAFYRRGKMVGREGSREGAGTGAAGVGTPRADRSVDIDDTSFPKKGQHSVGVARQYCGELGKQDNCQVAVTLSIANHDASLPVAYRLYLPKEWASDRNRRRKVGVPDEISFKTKPEIALAQIRWAYEAGLPRGAVLMDAGYGVDTDLRASITALGLSYVAGIQSHTTVWAPGTGPRPPKQWSGHVRPPKLLRRDDKHKPASVKELALALPKRAWRTITWREATGEKLSSRFARVRARFARRDYLL